MVWVGGILGLLVILLGVALRSGDTAGWVPRARPDDASPLGGKAFRMLLEREGLRVERQGRLLTEMPAGAKLWILLDPATRFTGDEAKKLLDWVKAGNTLIWAATSPGDRSGGQSWGAYDKPWLEALNRELRVQREQYTAFFRPKPGLPLPPLSPLGPGAASIYRTNVAKASGSGDDVPIGRAHLRISSGLAGAQLARVELGKGRVFVAPDAMSWTNYALADGDTAILAMNMVRAHAKRGDVVVWDERQHDAPEEAKVNENLLYFLWRPPLRYALLQVLAALALVGLFAGRRLGRAVPLQSPPNAVRASQWALAMSSLFQKVERPHVAAVTSGEHFRRALARRVGLSPGESDEVLSQRAAQVAEMPYATIDHLLQRARTPSKNPNEMLRDVQQMELLLQQLQGRR
jgi:hypothetical protein